MNNRYTLAHLALAAAAVTAAPLAAQTAGSGLDSAPLALTTPAALTAAAASIRAADLARHRKVLTADSLSGGATASRNLEATARYVAAQFEQLGLQGMPVARVTPEGIWIGTLDTMRFLQRYPLPGKLTAVWSRIDFSVTLRKQGKLIVDAPPKTTDLPFEENTAFFAADSVPQSGGGGPWASQATSEVTVIAGPHTVQTVSATSLQDKLVLYVPHAQADPATRRQIVDRLRAANRVVILNTDDSAAFAARRQAATARPTLLVDRYLEDALGAWYWAVEVRAQALQELLTVAGIDPAAARVAAAPTVRQVPAVTATLLVGTEGLADSASNVFGAIPGRDTTVRDEYVVYSAPMAHASELLALAKAFRQPGAEPRRSVLFAALSGDAPDFAGATYFAMYSRAADFTVNLTLGPLGRSVSDSVTIAGLRDLALASRPEWVASQHPDVGLAVADGGTIFGGDGVHLPLLRRAVPSLYISNGDNTNADLASADDLERTARALRFAFYLGQDLANAPRSTRWTSNARRERVRFLGR